MAWSVAKKYCRLKPAWRAKAYSFPSCSDILASKDVLPSMHSRHLEKAKLRRCI